MFKENWKKNLFTIPNILSLFRLGLIPVYMTIYLNAQRMEDFFIAGGILAVSCLTDAIDGKIARRFNMISTVGKVLDPIADKATQFTLILCLAIRHPALWGLVGLFVIKEGFQLIAGLLTLRKGLMLKGALLPGKICTAVLFVSLTLLVLMPEMGQTAVYIIAGLDFLVLAVAFIAYIRVYFSPSPMLQKLDTAQKE